MIVLGIDPGLTRLGFGVVRSSGSRDVSMLNVGVFNSSANAPIEQRIGSLANEITELLRSYKPDAIAIERVFAQSNLRSVMGVAQISGVVLNLAFQSGIPITFYTPSAVKKAVTGSGRADKAQVGFMVAKILKLSEVPRPADASDSLAIAICHAWHGEESIANSLTEAQQKWLAAVAKAKAAKG